VFNTFHHTFFSIKDKINNPPKKADVQEMPKSILRIMELKERAKTKKQPKHKKKGKKVEKFDMERALGKEIITPGMDRPDKKIPLLQQGAKERIHSFTNRVTRVCDVSGVFFPILRKKIGDMRLTPPSTKIELKQ